MISNLPKLDPREEHFRIPARSAAEIIPALSACRAPRRRRAASRSLRARRHLSVGAVDRASFRRLFMARRPERGRLRRLGARFSRVRPFRPLWRNGTAGRGPCTAVRRTGRRPAGRGRGTFHPRASGRPATVAGLAFVGVDAGRRFAGKHPAMVDRWVLFGPIAHRPARRYEFAPTGPAWRIITLEDQWKRFVEDVPASATPVLSPAFRRVGRALSRQRRRQPKPRPGGGEGPVRTLHRHPACLAWQARLRTGAGAGARRRDPGRMGRRRPGRGCTLAVRCLHGLADQARHQDQPRHASHASRGHAHGALSRDQHLPARRDSSAACTAA